MNLVIGLIMAALMYFFMSYAVSVYAEYGYVPKEYSTIIAIAVSLVAGLLVAAIVG
ncbi:MAG: hypothetical protein GXO09_00835 [Crenarchaeota archaeon]|nr:hypothetical protein [Thermoproteota archaeon]